MEFDLFWHGRFIWEDIFRVQSLYLLITLS
jgi:hypothetical protein